LSFAVDYFTTFLGHALDEKKDPLNEHYGTLRVFPDGKPFFDAKRGDYVVVYY
jgi:hypothetical protein